MTRPGLILAASLLLAACQPLDTGYNADRTPRMKPNPKIDKLFVQTKPVCFGRFLIDVPATAQVVWGTTDIGPTISSYPGEGAKIPAEIRDKTKEIESIKHLEEPSTLIGTFDGPNPQSKIVVGYRSRHDSGLIQLHSFIRLGKHAFVQSAPTAPLHDLPGGGIDKTSYTKWLTKMQGVARRLRVREESEIPEESGVCIDSGFVNDGDDFKSELVSIGFRFPEYPDVSFSIQTQKTDRLDETNSMEWALKSGEAHARASGKMSWFAGIKRLREGARRMGDWTGGELLMRVPPEESGGSSVHEFLFRSVGVVKDPLRPIIDMSFSSGVDGNDKGVNEPSLSNEEAVALWDRLTSTIRARPVKGGDATATNPEAPPEKPAPHTTTPRLPLGTVTPSLQRCPQTGLWECTAELAIGEKRRFFPQGMVLPTVIVHRPERSLWQKMKGEPPNVLAETTWTLVSYDISGKDVS